MEFKAKELGYLIVLAVLIASLGICSSKKSKVISETTVPGSETSLTVHVAGEVNVPGVYSLPVGSRVLDAINAAGGATERGDLHRLNLADILTDGKKIYLPSLITIQDNQCGETLVNINTANAKELESLPGIGPSRAQKIIDYRDKNGPFSSIEEITKVDTIGPKIFEAIQELITF